MKFYLCTCTACTWKGNKPHRDGQCPVCGNALEIQIRERRHSPDLATKVILSGLSTDQKVKPPLLDLSTWKNFKFSGPELKSLLDTGEAIGHSLFESASKIRLSQKSLKMLSMRFFDES